MPWKRIGAIELHKLGDLAPGDVVLCLKHRLFTGCLLVVEKVFPGHVRAYQRAPIPGGNGELGEAHVRFRHDDQVYLVGSLPKCDECDGAGEVDLAPVDYGGRHDEPTLPCDNCDGRGYFHEEPP